MDEKNQAMTASGINVLAGIWLIIAPFVLGYATTTPKTNDIWLGIIVGIIALIRIFTPLKSAWLSWLNIIAGVWLIIAPFVLNYATTTPRWNDVILGIIVIALSIWSSGAALTHQGGRPAHI